MQNPRACKPEAILVNLLLLALCSGLSGGCTSTALITTGAVAKTVVMAPIRLGEMLVEAVTDDDKDKGRDTTQQNGAD